MKRFKIAPILFLSLLLSFTFSVEVAASSNNALVILDSTNITSIQETRNFIKEEGGRITHIYPPHFLIGHIPENIAQELTGEEGIAAIHYGLVDPSTVEKYGKTAVYAVEAWNNNFMGLARNRGLVTSPGAPEPPPIKGDALIPPYETVETESNHLLSKAEKLSGAPFGAALSDTSEYMIGDIAVGIILMESNAVTDPNTEDWTFAEESAVISEIQAAMNWWSLREPNANLTFTYDINTGVETAYEPINRPGPTVLNDGQNLWIPEAMTFLGYTAQGNYFDDVRDYNGAIRDTNNADWGFTIFVIDSSIDSDGEFTDGYFAYAYLGGPFMVMTYDNDAYGIANMDAVAAHEMGHIFYALDEYAIAKKGCTIPTGYLNVENQNSEYGTCSSNVACIMRGQITPFTNGDIGAYSMQQIGWRDTNSDGIQDIVDTYPNTILNTYSPDPTTDITPTYTGSATVVPYPNNNPDGNGNDITINTLNDVEYRIDSGSWTAANAGDGTFDGATEGFTFTTQPLNDGTFIFETRATNSVLNTETSYASDSLSIQTQVPNDPSGLTATAISSSQINLNWTDSSDNETGFKIKRKTDTDTYSRIVTVGAGVTTYNNTGLSASTKYYYQVWAYNSIGDSADSNEANATTNAPPPPAAAASSGGGGGGGCFIATAAYGSYMADEVMVLREFRDKYLLTNPFGRELVKVYYKNSPPIADIIKSNEFLRTVTRAVLTPVVMGVVYPHRSLAVFIVFLFAAIALRLIRRQKVLTT